MPAISRQYDRQLLGCGSTKSKMSFQSEVTNRLPVSPMDYFLQLLTDLYASSLIDSHVTCLCRCGVQALWLFRHWSRSASGRPMHAPTKPSGSLMSTWPNHPHSCQNKHCTVAAVLQILV